MTAVEFNTQMLSLNDRLNYFALSLTANKDDAEDLLQETYLKALRNREKFKEQINFKAWIYTIMKNIFINTYRRTYKSNTKIDSTDDPYQLDSSREKYVIPPDVEFNAKEINRIIESLSDDFRIPFRMHYEGFKYKEIADELDLNIGTVKSRIFHARKKLMGMMQDYR